jgi:hypothetical protein
LRKATWAFTMLAVAMMLFISISFNARNVKAEGNYTVQHVDHTISVLSNGYVLMNDTVELSGQAPDSFLFGFPYAFGPYVVRCLVLDASNNSNTFPVSLSQPLEDHIGFYGINVSESRDEC